MSIADPPAEQSTQSQLLWDGYRWRSSDGALWWDGRLWRPVKTRARRSPTLALLRVGIYGAIACILVFSILSGQLGQLRLDNQRLSNQAAQQSAQINDLQSTIDDLRARWLGDPALWQPSGLPANTVVRYFAVQGTTQQQLISSLDNSGLCSQYHCLADPAVPSNAPAWALEGEVDIAPSAQYCYSPKTFSFHWTQHFIVLPQWTPKVGAVKTTLVQRWNALEAALLTHEAGHVKVADDYLASLNQQSQALPSCQAEFAFWEDPHIWDGLSAAQNAYHAKLRADCRPEIGCIPYGWMGW